MKRLADFKRALIIGSKWEEIHVKSGDNLGIRRVARVLENSFGFLNPETGNISYCDFPKASDYEYDESTGEVRIYWNNGEHVLTYKKVE